MIYTIERLSTYEFQVINAATRAVEYRGNLETAMKECSRLNLLAKGAPVVSKRKAARLRQIEEARQGGQRT